MATTPVPTPVDPQIAQLIDQEAARLAAAAPGAPTTVRIPVAGREIEFQSPAEIGEAITRLTAQMQQQQAQLHQFQAAASQQPQGAASPQAGAYVTGQDRPKVDMERYVALIQQDPLAAAEYVDELRYGVEKPSDLIKSKLQEIEEVRQILVAEAFKSMHPEFPGGAQLGNTLDQIRTKMNLPFNTLGLEAAYALAKERGIFPDFRALAAQQAQQQAAQQQQTRYGVPPHVNGVPVPAAMPTLAPPMLGRSAHGPQDSDMTAKLWGMTADQISSMLERDAARQGR